MKAATAGRAGPWAVPTCALLLAVLTLGPALLPGVVLTYDMVFVPGHGFTPFVLGVGTPAPRAVPSDAVVALASLVLPTSLVQKALLLTCLAGTGLGCARLVRDLLPDSTPTPHTLAAQVVAAAVAEWNPFVAERLVLGQWTVLAGLAILPWALSAVLRVWRGARLLPVCGWVCLAALGGANTTVVVLPAVLLALLLGGTSLRVRLLHAGGVTLLAVAANAAWWLPAVVGLASREPSQPTTAFAARSDNPLGLVVTLVGGGGIWNPSVVPPERDALVVAIASLLAVVGALCAGLPWLWRSAGSPGSAGPRGTAAVLAPAVAALVLVVALALPPLAYLVADVLAAVPGGGLLRDGQKLMASWVVLVSVCAGGAVARMVARVGWPRAAPLAALSALVPVALLPSLALGASGRLDAVQLPDDYARVAEVLADRPAAAVGSAPWGQYRRYDWNGGRVSLDILPRVLDRRVVVDDSLPLRDTRVPGEDPVAARLTRALDSGTLLPDALRNEGVRYLVVDVQSAEGELAALLARPGPTAAVLHAGADLALVDLDPAGDVVEGVVPGRLPDWPGVVGAAATLVTTLALLALIVGTRVRRGRATRRRRPTRQ
jgi:hypothetical protein